MTSRHQNDIIKTTWTNPRVKIKPPNLYECIYIVAPVVVTKAAIEANKGHSDCVTK